MAENVQPNSTMFFNSGAQQDEPTEVIPETPVPSSNVATVGPYFSDGTLQITFLNGAIYIYEGVPEKVVQDILHAHSVGSYVYYFMQGYAYERVG